MSDTTEDAITEATPTPKDVAEATPEVKGEQRPDETPEQTIDALRAALTKANREAKDNRIKAQELDGIKQAQMSDLERAQQEAHDAKTRLAEYERTNLVQRIAIEKGVPANLVDRLRGDTEDDIAADADALLALVNAPGTPKPDPTQGSKGSAPKPDPGPGVSRLAAAFEDELSK